MKKIFEVHQQLTAFTNKYLVLSDQSGELKQVAFAKQKPFAMREHFEVFTDDTMSQIFAEVKANKVMEFRAAYSIFDPTGKFVGAIKKEFKKSLLNSSWTMYADQSLSQQLFTVKEKSQAVAIARRVWGLVPYLGALPFPMKFHFVISSGDKVAGEYSKITLVRDHYALELDESESDKFDLRVWIGLAIMLDALESR